MSFKSYFLFVLFLGVHFSISAQDSNIFLDRTFWKSNPSIETIDKYISEGNDITALNQNAFDAISYALIEKVDNSTIKYLLSKEGNGVNKITHDGRTYIFWAAYKSNLALMQFLIDNGACTDIIDSHGNTVLNFAASTGQQSEALYELLFKYGSDITSEKNHDGANALLLIAPYLENLNLIDYFTSKGASMEDTDSNGYGLFDYAARGGHISFLNSLLKKGLLTNSSKQNGAPVIMASLGKRGHRNGIEVYQFLKEQGINLSGYNHERKTAFHNIAYRDKDLDIINYFLNLNANVNAKDKDGNTPFLNAARSNSLEVLKALSQNVENFNLINNNGQTALARAVQGNHTDVVSFLIEKGSDVTVKDKFGNSLAYYLLNSFRSENTSSFESKLELLLDKGLELNQLQAKGNTLIHLAVEKNNLSLVKRLVSFGIDVNHKNNDGLTALHLAAMKAKDPNILNYLISIGADKHIKTDFEESVYDLAAENELLSEQNIDISFLK